MPAIRNRTAPRFRIELREALKEATVKGDLERCREIETLLVCYADRMYMSRYRIQLREALKESAACY